jgi:hypothetical protein
VRVPDNAGSGSAKVVLSFPGWRERPIAPATFQIPIQDAPPSKESPKD